MFTVITKKKKKKKKICVIGHHLCTIPLGPKYLKDASYGVNLLMPQSSLKNCRFSCT